jgi:hypothetical protein
MMRAVNRTIRILLSGLLLAQSLVPLSLWAKAPPPGAGTDMPANIMLMLDTSGSMGWTLGSSFEKPYDIAIDSSGNSYLTERYRNRVSKYDPAGNLLLSWGSYGTGAGAFRYPMGITIDQSDNIYVVDSSNHRIQKFSTTGVHLQTIGAGQLNGPRYVAVDGAGTLFVSEYYRHQVSKFGADGTLLTRWGSRGSGAGEFKNPRGISIDSSGYLYVADTVNHRIQKFDSDGNYITRFGGYGSSPGSMIYPADVAVGEEGGYLYVMDRQNDRVQRFLLADLPNTLNTEMSGVQLDQLHSHLLLWGSWGSGDGQFNHPYGLTVFNNPGFSAVPGLDSGDVFVAGYYNNRYQRFSESGTYELTVGASSRLDLAKKVISSIVSDSDLIRGANFGLTTWSSSASVHTCISRNGAAEIKAGIGSITAGGGTSLGVAMGVAQNTIDSGCWPYVSAQCEVGGVMTDLQKNFMIVISDGVWSGHDSAKSIVTTLSDSYGVKSFVIGFMLGSDSGHTNYDELANAGDPGRTPPAVPMFAENWEELYAKLATAIRKAIEDRLEFSFTSPVTMPALRSGNSLYRSHFIYHKAHQWEGHLTRYNLSHHDGRLIEPPLWDAGEVLNQRTPDSRKLFTAEVRLESPLASAYNNFSESYIDELAPLLYPGSALGGMDPRPHTEKLIRFVRGYDAYDEYDEAGTELNPAPYESWRWKMGDIYNAEVAVVPEPSAQAYDNSEQPWRESYYRHAQGYESFKNSHVGRKNVIYAASNSGLLHAFDADDGTELWGFIPPSLLGKLRAMDVHLEFPYTSNSIFGIDGSVVVKDIKVAGVWKSVLLAGLGAGGNSYFALDVTDPDAPSHLFTIENQPEHQRVTHWSADGTPTEHSYAAGNTIDPQWDYSLLGEAWSKPVIFNLKTASGNRWVATFGNGYNQNRAEIAQAALYVMDLENSGQLLWKVPLDEVGGDVVNAAIASPTVIDADAVTAFRHSGAILYLPDLEGTLWKVDLSDGVDLPSAASTTLPVARVGRLFRDSTMTTANGRLVYYGSAAAMGSLWLYYATSDQQNLYDQTAINRLYGVVDPDFPSPRVSVDTASTTVPPALMEVGGGAGCPPLPARGWRADLGLGKMVTDRPNVKNQRVYFPLFTPHSSDLCQNGSASLVAVDMYCGSTLSTREIGEGILKGGVHHRGQTYYSLGGAVQSGGGTEEDPWSIQNNVVVSPAPENRITIDGWREDF